MRYRLSSGWLLKKLARFPTDGRLVPLEIRILGRTLHIYLDPHGGDRPSFFEVFYELGPDQLPPNPPDLVIDAGAHVGFFSLLARAKYPSATIHAFEPLPRNVELLRRHVDVNFARVSVHSAALWTENRMVEFVASKSNDGRIHQESRSDARDTNPAVQVRSVRLGEVLPEISRGHLLLKMDIEGAELDVLEVSLPLIGKSSMVLCELHDTETNLPRFLSLMTRYGWSAQVLKDAGPHSYWKLSSP